MLLASLSEGDGKKVSDLLKYLEKVQKDPGIVARTLKQEDLRAFKDKYGVVGASGLKCPACAAYLESPGSLWWNPENPTHFVCRKCHLVLKIECEHYPIQTVCEELKKVSSGKGSGLPFWLVKEEK